MTKFCTKCGLQIPEGETSCPKCGIVQIDQPQESTVIESTQNQEIVTSSEVISEKSPLVSDDETALEEAYLSNSEVITEKTEPITGEITDTIIVEKIPLENDYMTSSEVITEKTEPILVEKTHSKENNAIISEQIFKNAEPIITEKSSIKNTYSTNTEIISDKTVAITVENPAINSVKAVNKLGIGGTLKSIFLVIGVIIFSISIIVILSLRATTKDDVVNDIVYKLDLTNVKNVEFFNNTTYDDDATLVDMVYYLLQNENSRIKKSEIEDVIRKADYSKFISKSAIDISNYIINGKDYDELSTDDFVDFVEDNVKLITKETGVTKNNINYDAIEFYTEAYIDDFNTDIDNAIGRHGEYEEALPFIKFYLSPISLIINILAIFVLLILMIITFQKKNVYKYRAVKAVGITLTVVGATVVFGCFIVNIVVNIIAGNTKDFLPELISSIKYIVIMPALKIFIVGAVISFGSIIVGKQIMKKHSLK